MSVGIVIVAKLSAHTNTHVIRSIKDAMNHKIQPITPCEGAASTGEVGLARTVLTKLLMFWRVIFSATAGDRLSIVSAIVLCYVIAGPL